MPSSLYVIHHQICGLEDRPFPTISNIRPTWRPLFGDLSCFYDLGRILRFDLKERPWWVNFIREHGRQDFEEPPPLIKSKPFIRNLGSIVFNSRQFRIGKPKRLARRALKQIVNHNPSLKTDRSSNYQNGIFGFDPNLEDQRMYFVHLELSKSVFIRAVTSADEQAEGRIFIHVYPSGYISLFLVIKLHLDLNKSLDSLSNLIKETRPWRTGNYWKWKSKFGEMSLCDVIEKVRISIQESLYIKPDIKMLQGQWNSALMLESGAEAEELANDLITARGEYEVLHFHKQGDLKKRISSLRYLIASRQGLVCVVTPHKENSDHIRLKTAPLVFFKKIVALYEFTNFKNRVYEDYAAFLDREVNQLRDFRLSLIRKMTREDIFRFSVYDEKIPQFLYALDNHIKLAHPFYRRIYSAISTGTAFDKRRVKALDLVEKWYEETSKWEYGLFVLWKKVISPLRSLLASK